MIDVDIQRLGNILLELEKIIDDYDEIQLNIFNQLKDSCINWHDGNSIIFEDKIINEKESSKSFLSTLNDNKSFFQYVYDEYKSIGDRLHICLDKKNTVFTAIDECIKKVNDILNEFDGVTKSFYYRELNMINSQRSSIISCKNDFLKLKSKLKNLYKKVENIEEHIASKSAKITQVNISKFDYSFE